MHSCVATLALSDQTSSFSPWAFNFRILNLLNLRMFVCMQNVVGIWVYFVYLHVSVVSDEGNSSSRPNITGMCM